MAKDSVPHSRHRSSSTVPQEQRVRRAAVGDDPLFERIRLFADFHQRQGVIVIQPFIGFIHGAASFEFYEYSILEFRKMRNT